MAGILCYTFELIQTSYAQNYKENGVDFYNSGHELANALYIYIYIHMNSVDQSSLQLFKTVHLYKRERHLCLQVNMRIHVIFLYPEEKRSLVSTSAHL